MVKVDVGYDLGERVLNEFKGQFKEWAIHFTIANLRLIFLMLGEERYSFLKDVKEERVEEVRDEVLGWAEKYGLVGRDEEGELGLTGYGTAVYRIATEMLEKGVIKTPEEIFYSYVVAGMRLEDSIKESEPVQEWHNYLIQLPHSELKEEELKFVELLGRESLKEYGFIQENEGQVVWTGKEAKIIGTIEQLIEDYVRGNATIIVGPIEVETKLVEDLNSSPDISYA